MVVLPIQLFRNQPRFKEKVPELIPAPGIIVADPRRALAGIEPDENHIEPRSEVIRKLAWHCLGAAPLSSGTARGTVAAFFSARGGPRFPPGATARPPDTNTRPRPPPPPPNHPPNKPLPSARVPLV